MTFHKYLLREQQPYDALHDIFYEIDVLIIASRLRICNGYETPVSLESRLLHTRNLIDFFEKTTRSTRRVGNEMHENDDVLAQDYRFKTRKIGISQQDRERLNKALAHITYERFQYRSRNNMDWPLKTTLLPVLVTCEEFIQYLIAKFLKEDDTLGRTKSADLLQMVRELIKTVRDLDSL